ncbi:MAG: fasciclin domain-containing protein [Flavobacteriaceae bacterium]
MKTFNYLFSKLSLLLLIITFVSCDNNDDDDYVNPVPDSVVTYALADEDYTSLVAALQAADGNLVDALSGSGPFTVLAPTNEAFSAFLSDNGFASLSDVPTDVLSQVLLNHVIPANVWSGDIVSAGSGYTTTLATGAGDRPMSLFFDSSNGVMFNGVSTVIAADGMTGNGVVHKIDKVIGLPTIVDHAVANSSFTSLVGALTTDGNTTFTSLLSSAGDFTVFAPTNDAFSSFENPNAQELNSILANHVIPGASAFSDQLDNMYVKTAAQMMDGSMIDMYINTDNGVMVNGMANVIAADVVASNGVIHVVDKVIDIPSVVDFAVSDPNFATLVSALTRDDLETDFVSILSSYDMEVYPFTVFAPTNEAFGALLAELEISGLADIDMATLSATLMHHVVAGANVRSMSLTDQMEISTLGGSIYTDLSDGAKLVDMNSRSIGISVVDVQAGNGVIHVIDQVILPNLSE